jgi:hypothetical protein
MGRAGLAVLLAAAVGAGPGTVAAASFALGEREQAEAVRLGEHSVTTEETFGGEWTLSTPAGQLTVMTPFYRLAVAARQAAFKQSALTPAEVQQVLKEDRDRLVFWAHLRGPRPDFARFFVPALVARGNELRPTFVQNERSALREADGRHLARCVFGFSTAPLRPNDRVVLVVRDRDGREVARFSVDLATIR